MPLGFSDMHEVINLKVKPGLSTYAKNIGGIEAYLQPHMNVAKDYVPNDQHANTTIFVLATAGE